MAHSQRSVSISCPPSWSDRPSASFAPEPWAISVASPRPFPLPAGDDDDAEHEEEKGSRLPWWFPTPLEGLAGVAFGATIGLLVAAAVVLDAADYTPPPPVHARAGHQVEASPRTMVLIAPATAPRRARQATPRAAAHASPRRR